MSPRRPFRSVVAATLAGVALLAACATSAPRSTPPPTQVVGAPPMEVPAAMRAAGTAGAPDEAFFEFQVEVPVRPAPGSCAPQYPDSLRAAKLRGSVMAQFIVDTAGLVQPGSYKALRSTHSGFDASVRAALPCMRYTAAQLRGRRVRQLVQQPFEFALAR